MSRKLISQFFCKLNSSKYFTCPSGKLRTEFTSPIVKSTSPGLLHATFYLHTFYPKSNDPSWSGYGYFMESHKIDGGRLCPLHDLAKGHKILKENTDLSIITSLLHGKTNMYMHRWPKFEIWLSALLRYVQNIMHQSIPWEKKNKSGYQMQWPILIPILIPEVRKLHLGYETTYYLQKAYLKCILLYCMKWT